MTEYVRPEEGRSMTGPGPTSGETRRGSAAGVAGRPVGRLPPPRVSAGLDTMGGLMGPVLLWLQDVAAVTLLRARRTLLRAAILLCGLVMLLWVSIFLYGSFYYSYMPTPSFSTPVHYYYSSDCDSSDSALCSFPMANISLLKNGKDQVMAYGQPYRISVELEMPESPVNQHLGMFMVKMSCYTTGGHTVSSVARSAMLHYRSGLLQTMSTLLFAPLLLSGAAEQKQLIEVELFSDYKANQPTIGAVIVFQSRRVQIYSAQLRIHAYFTGIRYILYNFPLMSAVFGVISNFTVLSVMVLFSYLQYIWGGMWPPEQVGVRVMMGDATRMQQRREEARKRIEKATSQNKKPCKEMDCDTDQRTRPASSAKEKEELETLGVNEPSDVQENNTGKPLVDAPLPDTREDVPKPVGTDASEEEPEESHIPETENVQEIPRDGPEVCSEGKTTLRQRPGPWMSL